MAYVYSSSSTMNAQAMEDKAERMLGIMGYCASQSMSSMGFTKTIEAEVLGVADAIKNTYRLRYQNASFEAMSENTSIQYKRKDRVLVSIPTGDLSDPNKLIVGLLNKTGSRHVVSEELDVLFDSLGRNLYAGNQEIELSSWTPAYNPIESQNKVDYRYELNMLSDAEEVSSYMKDASHIMMKFKLKTDFLPEQAHEKFGIELVLRYKRETSNEPLFRYYRFEPQNIVGSSIYNIKYYTEQSIVFELGESAKFFDGIENASVFFDSGFQTNEYQPKDVFIKNLEIRALNAIAGAATSGYHISLTTPKGAYFPMREDGDKTPEPLELKAKVYLNGVLLNENDAKLKYYWFTEDLTMTSDNPEYLKFGKEGWACINKIFSDITSTENGKEVREVEYEPGEASILITHDQIPSREKKFKCVVTYEDIVVPSSPIVIINADANYSIEIVSSLGKILRTGQKTVLTCKIKNKGEEIANLDNFIFVWKSVDLNESVSTYSSNTSSLEVKAEDIEKSRTYKCGVRAKEANGKTSYIGNADIVLTNEQVAADYTLAIKNGNQVFKYDANGASPVSRRNENPGYLEKLSFTIYDKKGQELTQEAIDIGLSWNQDESSSSNIEWFVPADDTFLEAIPDGEEKKEAEDGTLVDVLPDLTDGCYIFKKKDLVFKIKDSYKASYSRNQIKLKVAFKPNDKENIKTLEANTEFIFTKEGALGTNGTGAVCWIEDAQDKTKNKRYLEIDNKETNQIDFTTNGVLTRFINRSYPESTQENQFSEFQWSALKRQNELTNFIYSVDIGTENDKDVTTSFFDFENLYTSTSKIQGIFPKDDSSRWFDNNGGLRPIANFMQLSQQIDGKYCYSVMPIIATKYQDGFKTSDWKVCLKENTGYLSVLYETNGKYPKYDDNNDFELEVESLTDYIVEWFACGNFKNIVQDKDNQNKCKIIPKENYDSYSYANIVSARVYQKNEDGKKGDLIAAILIPVYFYINKYFNAAINEWDGNGIEINEKDGIVLSPQVGAGKKENDNSFTGVVMGSKATSGGKTETGLFGFNKGQQTIKLDAETGKSEFGAKGAGQIILDPTIISTIYVKDDNGEYKWVNNTYTKIKDSEEYTGQRYSQKTNVPKASIYSGNFYKDDGRTKANEGLLIDLTTPTIEFGSGNFKVNEHGHITAKGGGTIAGWNISDKQLTKGKVGLSSDNGKDTNKAFWAGGTSSSNSLFNVDFNGDLVANTATLGKGSSKITLGQSAEIKKDSQGREYHPYSAIYSGEKNQLNSTKGGLYLGTDGIALGSASSSTDENGNTINISKFQVNNDGTLYARSGYIGGSGKSGWTIGNTSLYNTKNNLTHNSTGVYIGTNGIGLGGAVDYKDLTRTTNADNHSKFEVTSSGTLYANNGYFRGKINATGGKIGAWSLDTVKLYSEVNNQSKKTVGLQAWISGMATTTPAIWCGGDGALSPFVVDYDGKLKASSAIITGSITANSIALSGKTAIDQFNNLVANTATIGTLTATVANIEKLVASKADIKSLNAAVADIKNLVASKATISDIKSEVSKVFDGTISILKCRTLYLNGGHVAVDGNNHLYIDRRV